MKGTIDLFEERINHLNNLIGEINLQELDKITNRAFISKENLKNITDVIVHLQKAVGENDTNFFKDLYAKYIQISPILDPDKLLEDPHLTNKEMFSLVMSNYDELKAFLHNLNFIKNNEKYLELNPVADSPEKIKKMKPLELRTMTLESKVGKMTDNIDELLKNYNETIDIINQKFALYNTVLDKTK